MFILAQTTTTETMNIVCGKIIGLNPHFQAEQLVKAKTGAQNMHARLAMKIENEEEMEQS